MNKKFLKIIGAVSIIFIILFLLSPADINRTDKRDEIEYDSEIDKIQGEREAIMEYIVDDYYNTLISENRDN